MKKYIILFFVLISVMSYSMERNDAKETIRNDEEGNECIVKDEYGSEITSCRQTLVVAPNENERIIKARKVAKLANLRARL